MKFNYLIYSEIRYKLWFNGSHMWKSRSNAYHKIIFLDNVTTTEFIDFRFCVSRITLYRYLFFLLPYKSQLYVFSRFMTNYEHFEMMQEFLLDLMTRLSYNMIHHSVGYCLRTTTKVMSLKKIVYIDLLIFYSLLSHLTYRCF